MSKDARFWRNVALIGVAHIAVVIGLVRWSREPKNINPRSVVWMNGGGYGAAGPSNATAPTPVKLATPPPETPAPPKKDESEEDRPVLTSAKSEIQLPVATPKPLPTATPRSTSTPAVKATPKPTPKHSPKPSPKPTTKPSPKKIVIAKATPKPSPKAKPSPDESDEEKEAEAEKKRIAKAALAKKDALETGDKPIKKAIAAGGGTGQGTSSGTGGRGGGAGTASQFGWYGSMLHDRFYSEWVQPTTTVSSDSKISALVKIRIEKDGRVSSFEVIKPSGNLMIDESVAAVAKRVTQVDPLPPGLGTGDHYDVRINFELNSEQ